jgi:hypothetical protein
MLETTARLESFAQTHGWNRQAIDQAWEFSMQDLAQVYDFPIGSTQKEREKLIQEYQNAQLAKCVRELGGYEKNR